MGTIFGNAGRLGAGRDFLVLRDVKFSPNATSGENGDHFARHGVCVSGVFEPFVFIPHFWKRHTLACLLGLAVRRMMAFTTVAVTVIRVSYIRLLGPDPNPNGLYIHFGIDFIGMVAHVLMAACVVWFWRHLLRRNFT